MNIKSEENMKELLQAIYKPVAALPKFKKGLLKRLADKVSGEAKEATISLWRRPKLWVAVAAVLILAAIGYGVWLPFEGVANARPPAPSPVTPPEAPLAPPPVTPPVTPAPIVVSTGILEIRVTDAPAEREMSAINVTATNIEVHKAGEDGGWIPVGGSGTFDLLKLQGEVESLCSQEIEVGHYTQIRMDIQNVTSTIDGETQTAEVKLPSGKLKVLISFDINENKTTAITFDFDAEKSLVFTGEGKIIFKPVVKLIVTYEDEGA
jgi:hypothetical protein